jgi:hypothetical protein
MDYSIAVLIWIVCGVANVFIAQNRGATNLLAWFLVGILFGPIGIVLALIGAKPPKPVSGTPVLWPTQQPTWTPTPQPTLTPTPQPRSIGDQASPGSSEAAYCPRCGAQRLGAFRYCRKCGLDFDAPPQA